MFAIIPEQRYSSEKREALVNKNFRYIEKYLKEFKSPIIQKYIPGQEISVDAFIDDDFKVKAIFLRKREFIANGESQVTKIFKNNIIEKKFKKYLEIFKFSGFVMMQAKIFKGQIYIIECNPRIGGASTVSINNGLDAFFWQISKIINEKYKLRFKEKKKNKLFRFPVDFYL